MVRQAHYEFTLSLLAMSLSNPSKGSPLSEPGSAPEGLMPRRGALWAGGHLNPPPSPP